MSIGNNIYKLRTLKNLSQGELADLLDVSRQSVSKWETDTAVPDLDKLMKLCDFFNVSLDEIVGRETDMQKHNEIIKYETKGFSAQKIIGYILFAFSLLFGVVLLIFGNIEGVAIILLPLILSIMACGLLCIFVEKKAWYWCIWASLAPMMVLTPHIFGIPLLTALTIFLIVVIIIMFYIANTVFKDITIKIKRKNTILLALAWLIPICVYGLLFCVCTGPIPTYTEYNVLLTMMIFFVLYILVAVLETYTVCFIKNFKIK